MNAKKLLGIKIAGFVGAAILVVGWMVLWSVLGVESPQYGRPVELAAQYRWAAKKLGPGSRWASPHMKAVRRDHLRSLARGEPVQDFFWICNNGQTSNQGGHLVIFCWRTYLDPAARAEYARRCQKRAEQEWVLFEADNTSCLPALALMGFLTTAYNVADAPLHRQAIARRFHGFRLWARELQAARWRQRGVAHAAIADYVLLDWSLLLAGRGAAAVVPDPLAAAQPGSR